jgi:NAD(P) transhydrogenase subunit alpha
MGNVLLQYATVLVLTIFVGTEIIAKVPSILHTPLMSGSNAIHGVILVGSMLVLGSATTNLEEVLGFLAVILGTLNVVGGFVVTDRMLEMFKARAPQPRKTETEEVAS